MPELCRLPSAGPALTCLLLAVCLASSRQDQCGQLAGCRADRPRLANGCCPAEAGAECRPEVGSECDTELGFNCVDVTGANVTSGSGTCRGRYNVTVTSVSSRSLSLAWNHFAHGEFEYVVLYRKWRHHLDVTDWDTRDMGERPSGTVKNLTPGTIYLLKVSFWLTGTRLGNTSETIIVDTSPAEWCENNGLQYYVGEQFTHECEDNCTCLADGEVRCDPLCPEVGIPELPEPGCHVIIEECCTYRLVCPVPSDPCLADNSSFTHGQNFVLGCRNCVCNHGQVECAYPDFCEVMEPTLACPNPQSREVEGGCCPEWFCEGTCNYENRTYNHLEYFTSSQCGLCQCSSVNGAQCASECVPVTLVLPDAACPDPHIRRDGCCETLHCYDPSLDITHYLRRMFALSYSPMTLTLSFEVDPQPVDQGLPLYCQYEILYANATDHLVTWQSRQVQPIDVVLQHDQPIQVEETLSRDSAIVVGGRAYVTLSGMHPDTTYYVKIIPLDSVRHDMAAGGQGQLNYSDTKISMMVVVKTKPLGNDTSCFRDGKEILHNEAVSSPCGQSCRCHLGQVLCQSLCESEHHVLAASTTCPHPHLEQTGEECCPRWGCRPSAPGCLHQGVMLSDGQSLTEACQVCTCDNATVHCTSVCPPVGTSPRPSCQLVNVSGQCCPQWMCPLESHPPYGVKSSILLHLLGGCRTPVSSFGASVRQQLLARVQASCAGSQTLLTLCQHVQATVLCPGVAQTDEFTVRSRRSAGTDPAKIPVVVYVQKNFSSDVTEQQTAQQVEATGRLLASLFNVTFQLTLDDGHVVQSADDVMYTGPTYLCDVGFYYRRGSCVLSEIESALSFKPSVKLTTRPLTPTAVALEWAFLGAQDIRDVTGLQVEYKAEGGVQWLTSSVLEPEMTSYNITSLLPDKQFLAKLVVLTPWSGTGKWTVGEVSFLTSPRPSYYRSQLQVKVKQVTVSENCAYITWEPLTEVTSQLNSVNIVFKMAQDSYYTNKQKVPYRNQSQVELVGLNSDTAYVAEVSVSARPGWTVSSGAIYFVTKANKNVSTELLVAVIITCFVSTISITAVVVTCFMWRRSKRKGDATGFENKTFGIQMENNNIETPSMTPSMTPSVTPTLTTPGTDMHKDL